MIFAFVAGIIAVYLVSRFVRTATLVFVLILSLPFVNTEYLRDAYQNEDAIALNSQFVKKSDPNSNIEAQQRGDFTNTNLEHYLEIFYEKEKQRKLAIPTLSDDTALFDILFVSIDSLSSSDLELSNAIEHASFKRFNIILENFSMVGIDSKLNAIRQLSGICGQSSEKTLLAGVKDECSLPLNLKNLGYSFSLLSDDRFSEKDLQNTLNSKLKSDFVLGSANTGVKLKYSVKGQYDLRSLMDLYQDQVSRASGPLFTYFNITDLSGITSPADYDARQKKLIAELGVFIDRLELLGKPTLMVLLPSSSSAMAGDHTQVRGVKTIPSKTLTAGRVLFKFIGLKKSYEYVYSKAPVSYMGLTEALLRSLSDNPFNDNYTVSFKALTDDLSQTAFIGENGDNLFMVFRNRLFYKNSNTKWAEYIP
ncbi:MAG: cellulose biosynthesis protein BcsG [Succinivibrio sp.]